MYDWCFNKKMKYENGEVYSDHDTIHIVKIFII